MTYVVSVAGEKGGTGKTTTAMSLAAVAAQTARVLVVDTDPQGSATWWGGRCGSGLPFDVIGCADPGDLAGLVRTDYDLIVLDAPGSLTDRRLMDAVVLTADVVLLPTPPAPLCLGPVVRTARQVRDRHDVVARALLNIVDPRQPLEVAHARDHLIGAGIACLRTTVRRYTAHERAPQDGLVVTQYPVRDRYSRNALDDYRRLVAELLPPPRPDLRSYQRPDQRSDQQSDRQPPAGRMRHRPVPAPRPDPDTLTVTGTGTVAGRRNGRSGGAGQLLQSYPQVAGCGLCQDYAAELVHLPAWDLVAATLAFHRKLHRIDITKIASEHFSVTGAAALR